MRAISAIAASAAWRAVSASGATIASAQGDAIARNGKRYSCIRGILARQRAAARARTPGRLLPAPGLQNALATPAWIQLAENGSRPGLPSPPSFHALFCR